MSNQDYSHPAFKRLYVGASGSGKTSLFWQHFTRERARVKFLYDHKAMEFCNRYDLQPCFDAASLMNRLGAALATRNGIGGIVPFVPSRMFPGDTERGFEFWCEWVFAVCETFKGRKLVGADELHLLVDTAAKPGPLLTICDVGRTYQMDCFFIASAYNAIHNRVKNQITEVFAFTAGIENAVDGLDKRGFNLDELMALKRGEWRWRDDKGGFKSGGKAF